MTRNNLERERKRMNWKFCGGPEMKHEKGDEINSEDM